MHNNLFSLCKQLDHLCVKQNIHIALAESCTGGMLSALLTDIAGSSAWYCGGVISYSNEAKLALLGVDLKTIENHGAVSEPVAKAMAQGALKQFGADSALSITGIAGPHGGSEKKPVGTVCFALADHKGVDAKTMHFTSGRDYIRKNACIFALEWMIMHLSIII
ncbi:MAG: competence damage-inducible protein A [uncultured bacterium]|nr:MAG: competence damage-inducible protein A [uncultured bacterium]OGT33561.1 MAG: hypothetical protein A3C44_01580 [Gammaproteobacteria bacterium RIFCSPHIGHO2_02_FULL_39_13]OGT49576.1 MAG: hypothetical protein A3E53_00325 [Gammaproteobacteria bacterium RIFCSPHIGHO2_12_FULL_39_24]